MKKQEEKIFFGMLIILVGFVIMIVAKLLTFIFVVIGAYFVIKGLIELDKIKKKNLKKKK